MTKEEIRAYNMEYLNLNAEQYDEHQLLWNMKMTEWPPDLWRYVQAVGQRYGICGEVISSSIADYLRATDEHTKVRPPTMNTPERPQDV